MRDGLVWVLGKRKDDPSVQSWLASLGPVEELTEFDDELEERYTSAPSAALDVITRDGIVEAVILYATHAEALPLGLAMGMRQPEVRSLLGRPQFSRGPSDGLVGHRGPGDRYDTPAFSVSLDYHDETGRIQMVQLILPSAVPPLADGRPPSKGGVAATLAGGLAVGGAAGVMAALGWAAPVLAVGVAAAAGIATGLRIRHLRRSVDGR